MSLSRHEFWALVGGAFLLAFAGALAGLWSLRPELVTGAGVAERTRCLTIGATAMAGMAAAIAHGGHRPKGELLVLPRALAQRPLVEGARAWIRLYGRCRLGRLP